MATTVHTHSPARTYLPQLIMLAAASFVVVTTEMLPIGLLPMISSSLHVSQGAVGLLMTGYAFTVALTASPFTKLTARFSRKKLLLALLVIFIVSNVLATVATGYVFLLLARLLGGLAHGVFWSIIVGYGVRLAPPEMTGKASALVIAGGSLAGVAGVPLGTALGELAGWRVTFATITAIGIVLVLSAWKFLPDLPGIEPLHPAAEKRESVWRIPGLIPIVAATSLVMIGNFAAWTYVSPMLHERAGISLSTVSVVLFVNGAAGLLGTTFAGSIVDRFPRKLAVIAPSALVSLFAALFLVGDQSMLTIALVTVWGLIGAMLPVALQTSLIKIAGDRADEASSLYVSGFNIGIGGGALIGGQLIAHIGLAGLPVFGGLLAIAGTIVIARGRHSFRPHAHHLPHSRSATDVDAPQLQPQR